MKRYYLAPLSVSVAVLAVALVFWLRSGDLKAPAGPAQDQPSALTASAAPSPLTPTQPVANTEPAPTVAASTAQPAEVPKLVFALPLVAGPAGGPPDREAASTTRAHVAGAGPSSPDPTKLKTLADLTDKELDELHQVLPGYGGMF